MGRVSENDAMTTQWNRFPISPRLAQVIASNTLDQFLEYRDRHGFPEAAALEQAVKDIMEAASMEVEKPCDRD